MICALESCKVLKNKRKRVHASRKASILLFEPLEDRAVLSVVTVPAGLIPGDQYRLMFLSNEGATAGASDIAYYNNIVTAGANSVPALAALNTTWSALMSTPNSNARDTTDTNPGTSTGAPIYNLSGCQVSQNIVAGK